MRNDGTSTNPDASDRWSAASAWSRRCVWGATATALVWFVARLANFTLHGRLNVDEFENVQMVWLFVRGALPFRDYLHTHPPLFNLLIAPVYTWMGPAPEVVGAVRLWLAPVTLGTLVLYGAMARRAIGAWGALIALALVVGSPWITQSLGEARPDAFTLPAVLIALWLYARQLDEPTWRARYFYGAAVVLGLGFLFTLKNGLMTLVIGAAFERLHHTRWSWTLRRRFTHMGAFGAIVAAPYALFLIVMVATGFADFEALDIVMSQTLGHIGADILGAQHAVFIVAFIAGHAVLVFGAVVAFKRQRPWREPETDSGRLAVVIAQLAAVTTIPLALLEFAVPHMYVPAAMFMAVGAAGLATRLRPWKAALWLAFALLPMQVIHTADLTPRDEQMREWRFVLDRVPPGVPVLDNLKGYGTYRPIIPRAIHYRGGLVVGTHIDAQSGPVYRALLHREVGAVLDDHLSYLRPFAMARVIDRCYARSKEYREVLFPREGEIPGCGLPRRGPVEGGLWDP